MSQIQQKIERLKAILLYSIMRIEQYCQENNCSSRVNGHQLWKVLYFADREYLARYGKSITNDDYIAMDYGPVPSQLYDAIKISRGDVPFNSALPKLLQPIIEAINVSDSIYIERRENPDMEELSRSEIECINKSVIENCLLTFSGRTDKSHDIAWQKTQRNREIDVFDIAKAGGADEEMTKYIAEVQENKKIAKATFAA